MDFKNWTTQSCLSDHRGRESGRIWDPAAPLEVQEFSVQFSGVSYSAGTWYLEALVFRYHSSC